jgi:HEAT repeat protein
MKIRSILITGISLLFFSLASVAQDNRTIETKVADLLARFPASDLALNNKLMEDMLSFGNAGIRSICDQIVPAGTVDDTRARFAIESLSRYLSKGDREKERALWEKNCITYATGSSDNGVADFFMKQLQLIGKDESAQAVKTFLNSKDLCGPAIGVITAVGGKTAETIMAESLKNKDLKCPAAVMNALASMNSQLAVNEYIIWASGTDLNAKASAYNALALSGSPLAYDVLAKAAKDQQYRWEHSGATKAFLNYARVIGTKGDISGMDKITKLVMSKCDDNITIQNKITALEIYTGFHGIDAMPLLKKAAAHTNARFRSAALAISLSIPGSEVINNWISYYPKAIPEAKPAIITTLGIRGDAAALPLVTSTLSDPDQAIRKEAAEAIVKISGKKAMPELITFMRNFSGDGDQAAAKSAIMSVAGSEEIKLLLPLLKEVNAPATKSAAELIAWNGNPAYFREIFALTASSDESVKKVAMRSLANLATPDDIQSLIGLLNTTSDEADIEAVRSAIAAAAKQIEDPEKRSDLIISHVSTNLLKNDEAGFKKLKAKLIPVLSQTGGRKALKIVLDEFEKGDPDLRDVCFRSLTRWTDYTASYALFTICASGNKTFEGQAFDGYVRQIRSSGLTDDQKLLLYRKIMPYALTPERKNLIITETGKLNTYQSLFFVSNYLDDAATSSAAAKAAMLIALPSVSGGAGLYGTIVREILTKALPKITGMESEYDKEMISKYLSNMSSDQGFVPMFNGKDLSGWQGLVDDPLKRARMSKTDLERRQAEADMMVTTNWGVKDGCITFTGAGANLCSVKQYGDFEMLVDWRISKAGDSGIYLRGSPQVQIWDTSRTDVGAQVGSGGLYNNAKNPSKPLKVADNPVGDWNTFRILMIGEKVSVWLNGQLVVDDVTLENYWDRKIPIFPKGAIELQAHGTDLAFRDIYVREISDKDYNLTAEERSEGWVALFNGRNLDNWTGNTISYVVENGNIVVKPGDGSGGNLYTSGEYADFIFRFEFMLTPGANNGLGIRAPLTGDAAYVGMELQILDNTAPVFANLEPYQYHGSVYGVIPARREFLKPIGEWNYEEVKIVGTKITITLNGTEIVNGDIAGPRDNGTMDHKDHPGLKNATGHIGFLGHGSELKFRNIRIKDLTK